MKENSKTRLFQICIGVAGTVATVVALTLLKGLPMLVFSSSVGLKGSLLYITGVSCLFFFPPYFAMLGLLNTRGLEEQKPDQEFMSSYGVADTSRKKYRRHFAAVLVGVVVTLALWTYNAVLSN